MHTGDIGDMYNWCGLFGIPKLKFIALYVLQAHPPRLVLIFCVYFK